MARQKAAKRRFGAVRQYASGRWTASYVDPTGLRRRAPETFATKTDADIWLSQIEADLTRGDWTAPDAGAVDFEEYALRWVDERKLAATMEELYRRLLRLHILPAFRQWDLDEITPPTRGWACHYVPVRTVNSGQQGRERSHCGTLPRRWWSAES